MANATYVFYLPATIRTLSQHLEPYYPNRSKFESEFTAERFYYESGTPMLKGTTEFEAIDPRIDLDGANLAFASFFNCRETTGARLRIPIYKKSMPFTVTLNDAYLVGIIRPRGQERSAVLRLNKLAADDPPYGQLTGLFFKSLLNPASTEVDQIYGVVTDHVKASGWDFLKVFPILTFIKRQYSAELVELLSLDYPFYLDVAVDKVDVVPSTPFSEGGWRIEWRYLQ